MRYPNFEFTVTSEWKEVTGLVDGGKYNIRNVSPTTNILYFISSSAPTDTIKYFDYLSINGQLIWEYSSNNRVWLKTENDAKANFTLNEG